MRFYKYYIGIDISKDHFDGAVFTTPETACLQLGNFPNEIDGVSEFRKHLTEVGIAAEDTIFCIEATGVYSELLCYQLHQHGYDVWLETPLKIKRAFAIKSHKTDPADAQQIAEYAFRYCDKIIKWCPKPSLINDLETWLVLREQIVKQQTGMKNFNQAILKKVDSTEEALEMAQEIVDFYENCLKELEAKMEALIKEDQQLEYEIEMLDRIPGFGRLTATNIAVLMRRHTALKTYPKAAAYIGICPYQWESGKSKKNARISHLGPPRIRKLLHLGARAACTHKEPYRSYYIRKIHEGKPKKLAINNVANKLLKVACAILTSGKPYMENYTSKHPKFN